MDELKHLKDTLVSFPTSLKLEELGFEPLTKRVHVKYKEDYSIYDFRKGEDLLMHSAGEIKEDVSRVYRDPREFACIDMYPAPTLSLAQRWIREKYKLHISVGLDLHGDEPKTFWCSVEHLITGSILDLCRNVEFDDYDKALEYAIVECLEMIKFKENKND